MQNLIILAGDLYARNFVEAGAFDAILGDSTAILASDRMSRLSAIEALPGYMGTVPDPISRTHAYARMRLKLTAAYRYRSNTMRLKTDRLPRRHRRLLKGLALPGVRHASIARDLRRLGPNEHLLGLLREIRPEVVIAPVSGYTSDALAYDACRAARAVGARSLYLVAGWDNLSAKSTFGVLPDRMGVWGQQSVEHAVRIHRMPRERVFEIGSPSFDMYLNFDPALTPPPYPKPYVLFVGSAPAFDELEALHRLDALFGEVAPDATIIYRPHPWREPRQSFDRFDERDFNRVVMDQQMRHDYELSQDRNVPLQPDESLPDLAYYPSLLAHAEFVVSPLSTMMVEAALLNRPVLIPAYDDDIHPVAFSSYIEYDHFRGMENVSAFAIARSRDEFARHARELIVSPQRDVLIREQMRQWLYFDDRRYSARLADAVAGMGSTVPDSESRGVPELW